MQKRALLSLPLLCPPYITPGASTWQFRGSVWAEQQCLDGSHSGGVQVLLQALSLSSSLWGNKSCSSHLLLTLDLNELFKAQRKPYGNFYIRFICCSQFFTLHCILALCLKLSDNLVMAAHRISFTEEIFVDGIITKVSSVSWTHFHIELKWCLQFPYLRLTINIHDNLYLFSHVKKMEISDM